MSTYTMTFGFSERFQPYRLGFNYIMAAAFAGVALIAMFSASNFQVRYLGLFALVSVIVFASVLLIFALTSRYLLGRWRQMSLHVGPEGLMREAGAVQRTISWDGISKVRFTNDAHGEPGTIEVFTKDGPPLVLFGYEEMSEVAGLIKERVPSTVPVEAKRNGSYRQSPLVIVAVIVAVAFVLEAVRRIGGETAFRGVTFLIQMALGTFFLTYGPLSKTNPNLRRLEVIMGVILIIAALSALILKAWNW